MADNANNNNGVKMSTNQQSVSIIGTGDLARTLGKRLAEAGKQVFCGSRFPNSRNIAKRDPEIGELDIQVVGIQEAIQRGHIIFLAIHSNHTNGLLDQYKEDLIDKVIVDMSNPDKTKKSLSHAEQLAARYPNSYIVKGYNTLSAYALENSSDQGDNKVHLASDHKPSLDQVDNITQSMGLETVTYSTLTAARQLERRQKKLFRGWGKPLVLATLVFIGWAVFTTIRFHLEYQHPWQQWPLHSMNKIIGLTSITLLGLCYLPGCVASIAQLVCCTKHRAFPFWLDDWLKARKQLGLLALWLGIIHGITSVAHNNQAYYRVFYTGTRITIPGNLTEDLQLSPVYKMNWIGEVTYILGAVAIGMMGILGVTSLPSVGSRLNWKQWVFVQSYLGHACLAVSIAHVIVQSWPYLVGQTFITIIKGVSTISLIIPVLALGLRILLLLPCFSLPLYKIRRGWECCRNNNTEDEDIKVKKESKLMFTDESKTDHLTTNNPLADIQEEDKKEIPGENKSDKLMLTTNIDDISLENNSMESNTALIDDASSDVRDDANSNSSGSRESGIDNPAFSSQDDENSDSVSSSNRESSHSDTDHEERTNNVHISDNSDDEDTNANTDKCAHTEDKSSECEHNENESSECEHNETKSSESERNDTDSSPSSNDINSTNSEANTDIANAETTVNDKVENMNDSDVSSNSVQIEHL